MATNFGEVVTIADVVHENVRVTGQLVEREINRQIKIDLLETQLADLSLKHTALELALIGVVAKNPDTFGWSTFYENYLRVQESLRASHVDRDDITMNDLYLDNYGLVNGLPIESPAKILVNVPELDELTKRMIIYGNS